MNTTIGIVQELLPMIIQIIGAAIVLVATRIGIPWLKEQRIYSAIQKFVKAAEKLASAGTIEKTSKKSYVVALLKKKGISVTPEIEALIEAAVEELDWMSEEIITSITEDGKHEGTDEE